MPVHQCPQRPHKNHMRDLLPQIWLGHLNLSQEGDPLTSKLQQDGYASLTQASIPTKRGEQVLWLIKQPQGICRSLHIFKVKLIYSYILSHSYPSWKKCFEWLTWLEIGHTSTATPILRERALVVGCRTKANPCPMREVFNRRASNMFWSTSVPCKSA